jgi:hypothetical protein
MIARLVHARLIADTTGWGSNIDEALRALRGIMSSALSRIKVPNRPRNFRYIGAGSNQGNQKTRPLQVVTHSPSPSLPEAAATFTPNCRSIAGKLTATAALSAETTKI